MGPGTLARALEGLPQSASNRLFVGMETYDDAGVYLMDDGTALIQTVDFFTPIVDNPYLYGQIAAANALSDIYAMGGRPLTALNILCFPTADLELEVLKEILRGGADKVREAGALLLGGHSIRDAEPKYGLAVTGVARPEEIWTNGAARPGDRLILTKPVGTGIIATAIKAGLASATAIEEVCRSMARLNDTAAQAGRLVDVNACTDITGFGLLGHVAEIAQASRVEVVVQASAVPLFPETLDYAGMGLIPGGAYSNRDYLSERVLWAETVAPLLREVFYDPQTSGGLLFSVPPVFASQLLQELVNRGVAGSAVIGEVRDGVAGRVCVAE